MGTPKETLSSPDATATSPVTSCRKKKNEEATFMQDVKDHVDEFIHASMDEHKTCFKKTMQKACSEETCDACTECCECFLSLLFSHLHISLHHFQMFDLSKVVAQRNSESAEEVESSLPLKTIASD